MNITERQNLILEKIVRDYINLAQPISSEFLQEKHNFDVSPATIRNEMQELTEKGFLLQPHTSAGRIPTDKAYRLFVDKLFEEGINDFKNNSFFSEFENMEREMEDSLVFFQILTKKLADFSSGLALNYLPEEKILLKEGWSNVLNEPEFKSIDLFKDFMDTVDNFEKNIDSFDCGNSKMNIYIGRENPISKSKNFSVIISQCTSPKGKKSKVALLGPKRMAYQKNINLINSLTKFFDEF